MNSEDLKLFLDVAINGNFSRASIEIGLSQSALSRRISALEAELNIRLFYRSGRGVVLTEAGHRLAKYATEVTDILQRATLDLSSPRIRGLPVSSWPLSRRLRKSCSARSARR